MPFSLIWFLIAVLPFLIFMEGWAMLSKFMEKKVGKEWKWSTLPYFVIFILAFIVVILWMKGYR